MTLLWYTVLQFSLKFQSVWLPRPSRGCELLRSACLSVCLSVCPFAHLSKKSVVQISPNFLYMCGRGSVLLWRQCDTLCTSGFVDDVMFSHNAASGSESCFVQFDRWRHKGGGGRLPSPTASCYSCICTQRSHEMRTTYRILTTMYLTPMQRRACLI